MSKLSLVQRKNIKENEEAINECKEKITKAVDLPSEVTIDVDHAAMAAFADKEGYQNRVGDVMKWFVEATADKLQSMFREETAKAALQAVWTTGVLRYQVGTRTKKNEGTYGTLEIENGDLVYTIYSVSNVGSGCEGLLDKLGDSSGLTVKAAQSMKEKEEERNEALEKMKEAVDLSSDVTLDFDQVALAAATDKAGYKDRLGEVIQWYLNPLADTLDRRYKNDEIAKAALQAVWTTGVIRFELGTNKKNESKYHETHPRDGDLVITLYQPCSNVDGTGSDLVDRLTDNNLNIPLKSAQNIKEKEEERNEALEKMKEAVGLSTDVTLDIDWPTIDAISTKAGYQNRAGDVVDWIIQALTSNIERMCKEEMSKEAFAEVWTTGVIRFEENKKVAYHAVELTNGDLVIQYKPENIASNVDGIGRDIEGKL